MEEYRIAIVGGGPMCTYALERLAALLLFKKLPVKLRISVFDRNGLFGAGEAHSDTQPETSYMNRIVGQITFAADESNFDSSKLLPKSLRPTFLDWCQAKYVETGDEKFNLLPQDIPKRYIHGLALRDMFQRFVNLLRSIKGISVDLYASNVIDVALGGIYGETVYCIHIEGDPEFSIPANQILFVTGHSRNRPAPGSLAERLTSYNKEIKEERYISYAYPLEEQITEEKIPPGCVLGVRGLGLTAIDIFLYLTEGRRGWFIPTDQMEPFSKLQYIPSGHEPALMIGFSPSGMFPFCRPVNAKVHSIALEHQGVFLTIPAVRLLRRSVGKIVVLKNGRQQRQIDFEKHVFPLIILEMAYLYYKTLFGDKYGDLIRGIVENRYRNFLRDGSPSRDEGIDYLLEPVEMCFNEIAAYVDGAIRGLPISCDLQQVKLQRVEKDAAVEGFLSTIFGCSQQRKVEDLTQMLIKGVSGEQSPWRHSINVYDHRFNWQTLFSPISPEDTKSGDEWRRKIIAFIEKDLANASQNNLRNPVKAACDGVWRDLRAIFSEVVDRGGLLPNSHKRFISIYMRYYNRLSNGPGIDAMRKILALIECGLLDVSIGALPIVEPCPVFKSFRIIGRKTGVIKDADVIIEGKTHPFNPALDTNPLYSNLLRRGLVRKWCNSGKPLSEDFHPGGLDLSDNFHPFRNDNTVDKNLTFIGSPAEGVFFFQQSAARPHSNSYVLNNIAKWADEIVEAILVK